MKQHTSSKIANRQGWLAITLVMSVIITLVLLMSSCGSTRHYANVKGCPTYKQQPNKGSAKGSGVWIFGKRIGGIRP